ncbi:MAG: hypothetical protein JWP29_5461, partial [Rhodoferax sp.]|nr:hypothetical protein [Rhodoferax sp.]
MRLQKLLAAGMTFAALNALAASDDVNQALSTIGTAKTYAWGLVGTPAKVTDTELAARMLFQKATPGDLSQAIGTASNEGKMYLLCIIKRTDDKLFTKLTANNKFDQERISSFHGDVLKTTDAQRIVDQIKKSNCDPLGWPA